MEAISAMGESWVLTPDALTALYQRTFDDVYRYLYRGVLGDKALAEDLTQETFTAVVNSATLGRSQPDSTPWVLAVARHKLIDHYRRAGTEHRKLQSVWERERGGDELAALEAASPEDVIELLRALSPRHQLVLVLRYLNDLSVAETATELGLSVRATESLLIRARRELTRSYRETVR